MVTTLAASEILIGLNEIVPWLKTTLKFKETYHSILSQQIIRQTARDRNVSVSEQEIQADADRFRHDNRLEKAAETLSWLADQQITPEEWEAGIRDRLLTEKLKEAMFGRDVERIFAENSLNFDQVSFYQIILSYEQLAQELFYQIEEREISFFEAAHLYDIDPKRKQQCGFEGKLYRWSFKPDIAALIFGNSPGTLLHPVATNLGYHIMLAEEFIPAELSSEVRDKILQELFDEWLKGELNHLLHQ